MKHLLFLRCRLPSCNLSRKNNKIESESQLRLGNLSNSRSCNLSRKNNKIESESQPKREVVITVEVVTYPVKIIKLKANHNCSAGR